MRPHHPVLAIALVYAATCTTGCSPKPAAVDAGPRDATPSDAAPSDGGPPGACIPERDKPAVDLPWDDIATLCAEADRGQPWAEATPQDPSEEVPLSDAYASRVQSWLRALTYRTAPYAWLHDARWRLTGGYEGCPPDGISRGVHPVVRIYYSPEVIDWMCRYRQGEDELPDAETLPDGAMIIKEMIGESKVQLARQPGTDTLWVAPPPDGQPSYDDAFDSWTIMIKSSRHSADGWYYAYVARTGAGNPPLHDRAAFNIDPYPGSDGPVDAPLDSATYYPTYWGYAKPDAQFPNYGFGNYCVYCHASAQGENTFSSFGNIMGTEIEYPWTPTPTTTHDHQDHPKAESDPRPAAAGQGEQGPRAPFPTPRATPLPGWSDTFTALDPPYADVWATRLPAQTWDHVVSKLGVDGHDPKHSQYLTSDQCEGCHEAGGGGQLDPPYMVVKDGDTQIDLSPWAEWSASPMGLAGRDPIFHAQLELERNIARTQPGLADIKDCIDNTCLHCHGAPGARQYNIDTVGQAPEGDPCAAFLPPSAERLATDYAGALFTQGQVMAWRDEDPANARYGALARDGINCTICHHIADVDLGPDDLKKTFTGNYRVGPPGEVYGPFPNPASEQDILDQPMRNALQIEPKKGDQITTSALCGTCHTVFLPIFDDQGALAGTAYEQTTYLEWLLSDFAAGDTAQSCQDCHMRSRYKDTEPLVTGIANIEDHRFPEADFLLPADKVDNPERPYNRHQLYGLNAFLNAYFQQFPLLLGYRQQDYMNSAVQAPLLTGRETVLEVARRETATVTLGPVAWDGDTLTTTATVQNLAGHSLPSGVGFRRLWIELRVLDASGAALWASGRTNAVGVILDGITDTPLPTESWQAGADGLPFQPHHQTITSGSQVQIYEENTQNQSLGFTSSFIHRYWEVKDNRLRPKGYTPTRVPNAERREEYGAATRPGRGPEQHWWPEPDPPTPYQNPAYPALEQYTDTAGDPDYDLAAHGATGLPGSDTLTYRITLPQGAAPASITATLYSQSAPPHYLEERFAHAAQPGAERQSADRLYYMAAHLNTDAVAADGQPYLAGYRLRVGSPATSAVPAR